MSQKRLLKIVGQDSTGRLIYHGVFSFYETHGLPLSDMLFHMFARDGIPDWMQLLSDMEKAGRPRARCFETLISAVNDACYPLDFRDGIIERLRFLQQKEE